MKRVFVFLSSLLLVWGFTMLLPGLVSLATATTIYFNDFQGIPDMSGWNYTNRTTDNNGETVLGVFNYNENVQFVLPGLSPGDYTVSFDFFILNTWDGNGDNCCGPDYFTFRINGTDFIHATFAMSPSCCGGISITQGYSLATPLGGNNPNAPGAADNTGIGVLDITSNWGQPVGNVRFSPSFTFTHPGGDLVLNFIGGVTQPGQWYQGYYDEPWAIDNVRIASVPEPASLWLLVIGLAGFTGFHVFRRFRRRVA